MEQTIRNRIEQLERWRAILQERRQWHRLRGDLRKQILFERGKLDRLTGAGCLSANGAYLNGWYYDQFGDVLMYYYLNNSDLEELRWAVHNHPRQGAHRSVGD